MKSTLLTLIPSLALVTDAFTIRAPKEDAISVCQGTGGFKCVSQFYFTICNGASSVPQMVAPGTQCVNDQITYLNGPANSNSTRPTFTTIVTGTSTGSRSGSGSGSGASSPKFTTISSKAPFPAGNSTATQHHGTATGTGVPYFPKTTSTTHETTTTTKSRTASAFTTSFVTSRSTSGSGSGSSGKPAITTPASGIASDASTPFTTSAFNDPSAPSELEVIPITSLR